MYIVTHDKLSPEFLAKLRKRCGESHGRPKDQEPAFIPTYLANYRYAKHWSRIQAVNAMAKKGCVIKTDTLYKYETGAAFPNSRALKVLAAIYDVSVSCLTKKLHSDLQPGVKDRRLVMDERAVKLQDLVDKAFALYSYRVKDLYHALSRRQAPISYTKIRSLLDGKSFVMESDYKPLVAALKSVVHMAKNRCY